MYIVYKGHEITINDKLLIKQQVEHNLMDIIRVRIAIQNLFEAEESERYVGNEKDILEYLNMLENSLQELWGFERDESHHLRQFELSHCSCPIMDNRERRGTGSFIINQDCPYHGVSS